jgi:large subunit ribosomal protein L1
MKRSKSYRATSESFDQDSVHTPFEAIKIAKEGSKKKFDETVDVAMRLGVDPRKADQMVRGTVNLPHGTGKTARVLVFANAEKADAAREAGADIVGGDDLIEKVNGGWLDFDAVVATPDMMGKVGRLGRVLGPRGLMPNPKTGTVTPDVAKAVSDIKGGKIEFRVDRHANLHFIIGKASFSEAQLAENYAAALEEVLRLKPASSKGRYLKKVTLSTTMGPGIQVDPNRRTTGRAAAGCPARVMSGPRKAACYSTKTRSSTSCSVTCRPAVSNRLWSKRFWNSRSTAERPLRFFSTVSTAQFWNFSTLPML